MHFGIQNIIFLAVLITAFVLFGKKFKTIWRNIKLGRDIDRSDQASERWKTLATVALGQSKMVKRKTLAGFFHVLVYLGFVLINIEVLEIIIDGIFGTHRVFASPLGALYNTAINFFEILAVLVIISCAVFLWRRNITKVPRFDELKGWAKKDGNNILIIEIVLMIALLTLGAAEANMENTVAGPWLISGMIAPLFANISQEGLVIIERTAWWLHIVGILAFLNYLPYSKHFHIIMAFPNVYFSNLKNKGGFSNLESVKKEVELMMDPNADPYAAPPEPDPNAQPERFGAKDVTDLNWVQLMNAYACTECGRCTSSCPANITGKKLSPRKIMMDTRDRLETVGANIDKNGSFQDDGLSLLDDHISREELWACTSCNACTEACPVNIDPLSIIIDMRRYLVMEESAANQQINMMMTNVENNGAPWAYPQADRGNWINE